MPGSRSNFTYSLMFVNNVQVIAQRSKPFAGKCRAFELCLVLGLRRQLGSFPFACLLGLVLRVPVVVDFTRGVALD